MLKGHRLQLFGDFGCHSQFKVLKQQWEEAYLDRASQGGYGRKAHQFPYFQARYVSFHLKWMERGDKNTKKGKEQNYEKEHIGKIHNFTVAVSSKLKTSSCGVRKGLVGDSPCLFLILVCFSRGKRRDLGLNRKKE